MVTARRGCWLPDGRNTHGHEVGLKYGEGECAGDGLVNEGPQDDPCTRYELQKTETEPPEQEDLRQEADGCLGERYSYPVPRHPECGSKTGVSDTALDLGTWAALLRRAVRGLRLRRAAVLGAVRN